MSGASSEARKVSPVLAFSVERASIRRMDTALPSGTVTVVGCAGAAATLLAALEEDELPRFDEVFSAVSRGADLRDDAARRGATCRAGAGGAAWVSVELKALF